MTATSLWELAERARKRLSEIAKGNRDRALLAMGGRLGGGGEEVLRSISTAYVQSFATKCKY